MLESTVNIKYSTYNMKISTLAEKLPCKYF